MGKFARAVGNVRWCTSSAICACSAASLSASASRRARSFFSFFSLESFAIPFIAAAALVIAVHDTRRASAAPPPPPPPPASAPPLPPHSTMSVHDDGASPPPPPAAASAIRARELPPNLTLRRSGSDATSAVEKAPPLICASSPTKVIAFGLVSIGPVAISISSPWCLRGPNTAKPSAWPARAFRPMMVQLGEDVSLGQQPEPSDAVR